MKLFFSQKSWKRDISFSTKNVEKGKGTFVSHGSNRSRCLCILKHPSKEINIEHSFKDDNGMNSVNQTEFNSSKLSLCNMYAP